MNRSFTRIVLLTPRAGCLVVASLLLAACVSAPPALQTPLEVIATVSKPRYTGWQIDHCRDVEAVNPSTACLAPDGDLYRVELQDVRAPDGTRIAGRLTAGLAARALGQDFTARVSLKLVKASAGFHDETGIAYIASRE